MSATSVKAHFDGKYILLDEALELEPNTKLIVTVLPTHDFKWEEWINLSSKRLEDAYETDEVEYSLDLIKDINPEYTGR